MKFLVGSPHSEGAAVSELASWASEQVGIAGDRFRGTVDACDINEPSADKRAITTRHLQIDPEPYRLPNGWIPQRVVAYGSTDPFIDNNPLVAAAASDFVAEILKTTNRLATTNEAVLTYLSSCRPRRGRRPTVVTKGLIDLDPGFGRWIQSLPDAEQLRVVAQPWSDTPTILHNKRDGGIVELPNSKFLRALTGGANDGWGVRERAAEEAEIIRSHLAENAAMFRRGPLRIASVGSGTGEPMMDAAAAALLQEFGTANSPMITVYGADLNPSSLAVAEHLASTRFTQLKFNSVRTNFLNKVDLRSFLSKARPHVVEMMGVAEYIPAEGARVETERRQRSLMRKVGLMSAEEFHATIYDSLTSGSIFVTGNMSTDSPEVDFVQHGLGWKGIIPRSTADYLRVLADAGIPGAAVELHVPNPGDSSGVYTMVSIKRL
ncbi:hypothetical protein [Streptomyces sp. SID13031]|uniref:hypothetical protein n=1 Tax=Streptomyces sp. SID13031 TaxID=2706046 RepID=UPI0013C719D9|nr:hypothetical protein [Streptomyces sp. SID13031]NEA37538.1 hypothetical protein [Streptomyces sp. SID13031]